MAPHGDPSLPERPCFAIGRYRSVYRPVMFDDRTGGGGETNLRITLAPSITTRVTGTAFDEEDAIGLSVVPWSDGREQPLSSSRWEDNVKFVYRDGQFVSSATAYFPDATTANTFYAYYPYNQTGFRSNTSSLAVAVATDQSDAASRTASDWMVAVTRNVKPDGQAVPVAFRHILSLMQIRMTAGDGVTADELLEAEVLLKDFAVRHSTMSMPRHSASRPT